jgi:hypothetical protein
LNEGTIAAVRNDAGTRTSFEQDISKMVNPNSIAIIGAGSVGATVACGSHGASGGPKLKLVAVCGTFE